MLEAALGILAVWIAWQVLDVFLVFAAPWVWWLVCIALGVGYAVAFIDLDNWWWGLGIGGGAVFIGLVADLMLLAGDACKVHVLRNSRTQGP
jgi:hypothetical protein